ncbi:hypothetical protein U1Q18_032661 [Sarracenia purpurea var. burkii]
MPSSASAICQALSSLTESSGVRRMEMRFYKAIMRHCKVNNNPTDDEGWTRVGKKNEAISEKLKERPGQPSASNLLVEDLHVNVEGGDKDQGTESGKPSDDQAECQVIETTSKGGAKTLVHDTSSVQGDDQDLSDPDCLNPASPTFKGFVLLAFVGFVCCLFGRSVWPLQLCWRVLGMPIWLLCLLLGCRCAWLLQWCGLPFGSAPAIDETKEGRILKLCLSSISLVNNEVKASGVLSNEVRAEVASLQTMENIPQTGSEGEYVGESSCDGSEGELEEETASGEDVEESSGVSGEDLATKLGEGKEGKERDEVYHGRAEEDVAVPHSLDLTQVNSVIDGFVPNIESVDCLQLVFSNDVDGLITNCKDGKRNVQAIVNINLDSSDLKVFDKKPHTASVCSDVASGHNCADVGNFPVSMGVDGEKQVRELRNPSFHDCKAGYGPPHQNSKVNGFVTKEEAHQVFDDGDLGIHASLSFWSFVLGMVFG